MQRGRCSATRYPAPADQRGGNGIPKSDYRVAHVGCAGRSGPARIRGLISQGCVLVKRHCDVAMLLDRRRGVPANSSQGRHADADAKQQHCREQRAERTRGTRVAGYYCLFRFFGVPVLIVAKPGTARHPSSRPSPIRPRPYPCHADPPPQPQPRSGVFRMSLRIDASVFSKLLGPLLVGPDGNPLSTADHLSGADVVGLFFYHCNTPGEVVAGPQNAESFRRLVTSHRINLTPDQFHPLYVHTPHRPFHNGISDTVK